MHPLQRIFLVTLLVSRAVLLTATEAPEQTTSIWPLDQVSPIGGQVTTVWGAPHLSEDPHGRAVQFNGVNDGIFVPLNPLEGWASFTIEALIRPETGGAAEQRFLHIQDKLGNRALLEIRLTNASWALDTFLGAGKSKGGSALLDRTKLHPANQWTWVALVVSAGHMAHYINGVKELEGAVAFSPMVAGQISLGVRQNQVYWFKGGIREVRFHPAALTGAQLQQPKGN